MRPRLENAVIRSGKCTACGGCDAICPVGAFEVSSETATMEHHCIECLLCDAVCPVLDGYDPDLGYYKFIVSGKSGFSGQAGGMAQALIHRLFEEGEIDCVIGISRDKEWRPIPTLITDMDDFPVLSFSKYTYSPLIETVEEAILQGFKRIAVIGLGCQIHPASLLRERVRDYRRIAFLLGLFCTRTFKEKAFFRHVKEKGIKINEIRKFDIRKGRLVIEWGEKKRHVESVKDLSDIVRGGCLSCEDVTAYSADIALGSVGSDPGFNTIIVRSMQGLRLWRVLKEDLEVRDCRVDAVRKLTQMKRREVKLQTEK